MARLDTYGEYVRNRLERWGVEFALHRDCEYLGHQSKNMIAVLMEHEGEMPPRPTGFKPLEIPIEEQQIEDIVAEIARANLARSIVLRAYYCGTGRRGEERRETANEMLARLGLPTISRRSYFTEHDLGFEAVRWMLNGLEAAA